MSTIDDFKKALRTTDPATSVSIALASQGYTFKASDLDVALSVAMPNPMYYAYASDKLNLRPNPSASGYPVRLLQKGDRVTVTDVPVIKGADGHDWTFVLFGTARGWVAGEFLLSSPPQATPPVTPNPPPIPDTSPTPPTTPPIGHLFGLHFLQNADWAVKRASGMHIASATVVNNPGLANSLVDDGVPYVLYRHCAVANEDALSVPSDAGAASSYGTAILSQRWSYFQTLKRKGMYIQLLNESPWNIGHGPFWLAAMIEADRLGVKLAMGGYAVGGPEPEQWATMVPALQYAAAHGHIVCLHEYTAQNTPAGQLSAVNLEQYYELRWIRFYKAVPEDAQPPLVIGEFGNWSADEDGAANEINLCKLFETEIAKSGLQKKVRGYNYWTCGDAGGWGHSAIDKDLDAFSVWLAS